MPYIGRLSRRQTKILKNRPHLDPRPLPSLAQLERVYLLEMQEAVSAVFRAKNGFARAERPKTLTETWRREMARERI